MEPRVQRKLLKDGFELVVAVVGFIHPGPKVSDQFRGADTAFQKKASVTSSNNQQHYGVKI